MLAQEAYDYDASGNLDIKAGVDLNYPAANGSNPTHLHAVTKIGNVQKYGYDNNGNQITRVIGGVTFNLKYDAENRLKQVKKSGAVIAKFVYDGDGKRVKGETYDGGALTETTIFIGAHYEVTTVGSTTTYAKYYFAGATRIAMRKYTIPQNMTLEYFMGDHLGSTSLTTDATGARVSEIKYKPWGRGSYCADQSYGYHHSHLRADQVHFHRPIQ